MSRATPLYFPPSSTRGEGREHVVFESLVALLALILIVTGFSLYVSQAFAKDAPVAGAMQVSDQTHDRAYSLAEV